MSVASDAANSATAAARMAQEITDLRLLADQIERSHPTTVVQTADPASEVMMPGTTWVNKSTTRVFVSVGGGVWISADASRINSNVIAEECTTSTTPVTLSGPAVTIYVPPNGIVGIFADMELHAGSSGAGTFAAVASVFDVVNIPSGATVLQSVNLAYERRVTAPNGTGFGTGIPYGGWLVHRATTGWHTYYFAYSAAPGGPGASVCFRNRRFWVATF